MNILPFILFGFICASIVVFIFITVSCVVVAFSNKDQEDEEQIQWIKEYKDKKLREKEI
ncbi:hypothetical protein [Lacrimispora defluvii]|uniref:Uncharacterized protein n=1 Tax=Lacrimispora defluvii TaxID=2719233 RepID=A0ABX1W0W9_9FIRM|nr:hypothetical protein [Lacrimispora defluvii]NNJ33111.1 hypothetical protein [Lacrimispora defluvii]